MPNTPQTNQSPVANPNAGDAERAKLAGLAKRRQSLKKKLDMHSAFTNALTLAMAAGGLYITGTALWGLKNTFFVDILSNLAFGTATSPGIPVAIAQAFLPTALASFAPMLAIGVPLILLAYMISYQINANRYLNAGKDQANQPVATDTPDATNSQPDPDNNPIIKPNVDNDKQVVSAPATPEVSSVKPVQAQVAPAANEKSKPSKDNAKAGEKKPQGSLAPVVFNHQRQTRSQTKAARAAAQAHEHEVEAAPKTRAAKRQSSKKNH